MTTAYRDLSAPELWERSLARSRVRRALAPKVRREHKRRKGLSAAVAAATMAGPATPYAMAQAGDVQADVAAETASKRAIEVRAGGLPLQMGSQGPLVAEVQRALSVPADGVFGVQTDNAVRRYQVRAGLTVDGIVGPTTWNALFKASTAGVGGSNVPEHVKQRIENELQQAEARVAARTPRAQRNLFGNAQEDGGRAEESPAPDVPSDAPSDDDPAGESPAEDAPTTQSPSEDAPADDAPADTSPTPPAGGQERTVPGTGGCGSSTISSPVKGTTTSPFGPRWGRNHDGVDIAAPTGTAVRAAACGTVTIAGQQSGYGNMVCITHTSQFSTCYAHLSGFATKQGARVQQGQVIGYVGCTGSCTGPHLHFETRVNGQAQDPTSYLKGGSVPGASSSRAKSSSVAGTAKTKAGATNTAAVATTGGSGGASASSWSQNASDGVTSESVAANAPTAQAAVGPTTPTSAPVPAPVQAAPVPVAPTPAPAPAPVEAAPVQAAPVQAAPVQAAPVPAPVPVAPAPVAPAPAPTPVEAAPVQAAPAPVEAAPVQAAPAPAPAPVEAAPVEAAPVETAPAPAPVEAAPVEAAPVEAAPAPAPAEAAPVEAAPAEAAPVAAAPAQ